MNDPHMMSMLALGCALVAIASCAVCIVMFLRMRDAAMRNLALAIQTEAEMADLSRDLDTVSKRAADQARRIAWLESRMRSGLTSAEPTVSDNAAAPTKLNATERRHRVLSLARRGLDAESIASTLNVPHGEVELIIGLNRAA